MIEPLFFKAVPGGTPVLLGPGLGRAQTSVAASGAAPDDDAEDAEDDDAPLEDDAEDADDDAAPFGVPSSEAPHATAAQTPSGNRQCPTRIAAL